MKFEQPQQERYKEEVELTENEISSLTKYVERMSKTDFDKEQLVNYEKQQLEDYLNQIKDDIEKAEGDEQKKELEQKLAHQQARANFLVEKMNELL